MQRIKLLMQRITSAVRMWAQLTWTNFLKWQDWTSVRAIYVIYALVLFVALLFNIKSIYWILPTYLIVINFIGYDPLMRLLNWIGFTNTEF